MTNFAIVLFNAEPCVQSRSKAEHFIFLRRTTILHLAHVCPSTSEGQSTDTEPFLPVFYSDCSR
jgi:hypothetical protein